jgi:hypothetical protein
VAVTIQHQARRGVAQHVLQRLNVRPRTYRQRRRGVPQLVFTFVRRRGTLSPVRRVSLGGEVPWAPGGMAAVRGRCRVGLAVPASSLGDRRPTHPNAGAGRFRPSSPGSARNVLRNSVFRHDSTLGAAGPLPVMCQIELPKRDLSKARAPRGAMTKIKSNVHIVVVISYSSPRRFMLLMVRGRTGTH